MMPIEIDTTRSPRQFFTNPWDPVIVRRGDALGLRALADQFGDAVAPDLRNRIRDGRWMTILAWCLARSHETFHACGGRSVETRVEQRRRYAWLRPLELMWVARTIALAPDEKTNRALNGIRRVKPWYDKHGMKPDRFGMSETQFHAYRQTGMYGGYRLAFRKWPGMTLFGDGWTPGPATWKLAQWLDNRLKEARPARCMHEDESDLSTTARRARNKEHQWWVRQWPNFDKGSGQADAETLPRPRDDFAILPEASLLSPLAFGEDTRGAKRKAVARAVVAATARTHIGICDHLAGVFDDDPVIAALPRFSRLADAGMEAMDIVAKVLGDNPDVSLNDIARHPGSQIVCRELFDAARKWAMGVNPDIRHVGSASCFADVIRSPDPEECLRALIEHHEIRGGGLRWFALRDGRVEARSPARFGSSRYGFRFWPLCRLAVQCGILPGMPRALLDDPRADDDNIEEDNE